MKAFPWSYRARALTSLRAAAVVLLLGTALTVAIGMLPLDQRVKERAMQRMLWPIGVIQDPIFVVLNLVLPQDGFEPATMSLPSWARVVIWLSALGIAYCVVAVIAYGFFALKESRQKRLAS